MKYTNEERVKYARTHRDIKVPNKIHHSAKIHRTAIIGRDGFGYARLDDGSLIKMPHKSNVIIERDVEIGAHTCIDRGVANATMISEGNRIDNLCHFAHGCMVGLHNTFAAGCIVEGSCIIGSFNTFGTNVIVQTKIKIGDNCIFGSGAVITKDVPTGEVWVGNPARFLKKNTNTNYTLNENFSIRRSS